jgi:hypothetical protein
MEIAFESFSSFYETNCFSLFLSHYVTASILQEGGTFNENLIFKVLLQQR